MKKFLIVLLSFIISSCSFIDNKDNQTTQNESLSTDISTEESTEKNIESSEEKLSLKDEKNIKYSYDLDEISTYKRDESLSVNRMLFTYPSEVVAKLSNPYTVDDFRNLDYSKDLYYEFLNFRIPQRAQVFSNDKGLFAIDFPQTDAYNIKIYFNKIYKDKYPKEKKDEDLLLTSAKSFMDVVEKKGDEKIIQKPYEIFDLQMDAYYAISQDEKYTHTYVFIGSPNNIVFFEIVEEKAKSQVSKYLMADLLSTMYIESEDPINVKKSFDSYTDDMDLFATDKVDFEDFSVNLPKNMKKVQDDKNFKTFAAELKGDALSSVLIIKSPKKDKKDQDLDLDTIFNLTSGSSFPPAHIISMGQIKEEKIKDKNSLTSDIRIYMDNLTSEGVKTCIETDDGFVTIIVTGPLANSNETKLLNKNILSSLSFK